MWCACVKHAGNRMKSLSHCARVRWSSAARHQHSSSLSEPAKKSSWLTCFGDSLPDRKKMQLRLTLSVPLQRHMHERLNKTYTSIPAVVSFRTPHPAAAYAHVSMKHTQEASLPLGHLLDAISINARVPQPPTIHSSSSVGAERLPPPPPPPRLPTLSNKTKMLQMEGQKGREVCGGV